MVINLDQTQIFNIVLSVVGVVFTLLLTANGYFIRRLVHKMDMMEASLEHLPSHKEKIEQVEKKLDKMEVEMQSISGDYKEIYEMKSRISILEFMMKEKKNDKTNRRNGNERTV